MTILTVINIIWVLIVAWFIFNLGFAYGREEGIKETYASWKIFLKRNKRGRGSAK